MSSPLHPGLILIDRYRVVRELGHGGFGRTYLAEDINRFSELCVLKQFAPKMRDPDALQKAEELFGREAGVLYQLQHPQIPRFRELFRVKISGEGYLFLVQDYVEGENYRELLDTRKSQGICFNEAEVRQLLIQLLPVLNYIHSRGVIHRDISPDNLILRNCDLLPVLIDFGGVRQVAAKVGSQLNPSTTPRPVTRLGKTGYAPSEQMQMGMVSPRSDLYGLAATCLVLLTGKEPQHLMDPDTLKWNWHSRVNLSRELSDVLDRMLAKQPGDRPANARAVLEVLNPTGAMSLTPPMLTSATVTVAPAPVFSAAANVTTVTNIRYFNWQKFLTAGLLLASLSGIGMWAGNAWIHTYNPRPELPTPEIEPSPKISRKEKQRQRKLNQRRVDLDLDNKFYTALVDEQFYAQNPDLKGRKLTDKRADERLRAQRDQIAATSLDNLESLTFRSRSHLGSYTQDNINIWHQQLENYNLSSLVLNDFTDAKFKHWFGFLPLDQFDSTSAFLKHPLGQVWQAIASDYVHTIPQMAEEIKFKPNTSSKTVPGTLSPGEGKVFTADLGKGQLLEVQLQGTPQTTLLSIYPPANDLPPLLADSQQTLLSVPLPQAGLYQFVVINNGTEPIPYNLTIAADNIK